MDNLTLGKMLTMLAWAITLPLWFPVVWTWRKLFGRRRHCGRFRNQDRGRPLGMAIGMLVPFWMIGCSETPESRVERTEAEITRALNNAKKVAAELAKAEKTIADEKAKLADLIGKLNGLIAPKPSPTPNPAPSPVPTPTPPGPLPPVPQPLPTPTEPVDGRFAIARAVWKIGSAVDSPDRAAEAQALSLVFASVASQVAAGTLDGTLLDPQWHKVSVALTAGNKPIMAKHLTAWKSAAEQLSEAIATFYGEDKLKSNSDWGDLLSEISSGLKAVK